MKRGALISENKVLFTTGIFLKLQAASHNLNLPFADAGNG